MIIGVTDIETTGLDQEAGHRIIEICLKLYKANEETKVLTDMGKAWSCRFNPMRSIDPKAQAVHGISHSDLIHQPLFDDKAKQINRLLNACNYVVCHNVEFDLPFIYGEMNRVRQPISWEFEAFCTMDEGRAATPFGEIPSLMKLCDILDIEYDTAKAHAADYDVYRTADCLFKGVKLGLYKFPRLDKDWEFDYAQA